MSIAAEAPEGSRDAHTTAERSRMPARRPQKTRAAPDGQRGLVGSERAWKRAPQFHSKVWIVLAQPRHHFHVTICRRTCYCIPSAALGPVLVKPLNHI